jgi:hypothetical protein
MGAGSGEVARAGECRAVGCERPLATIATYRRKADGYEETCAHCATHPPFCNDAWEISKVTPPHDLTPSEVALARMLSAWVEWLGAKFEPEEIGSEPARTVSELEEVLYARGLCNGGGATDKGAALLDKARRAGVL